MFSQKGFSAVLMVMLIAVLGVGGYFIYRNYSNKQTEIATPIVYPTPTNSSSPIMTNSQLNIVKLSDAWNIGRKTYTNSKINITFDYPSYFTVKEIDVVKENADWQVKYKDNPAVKQPLYKSSFYVSFSTPDMSSLPDNLVRTYCDNRMSVIVQEYENLKSLSLYDFIADLNKTYAGDGITDTFDTYKKGLNPTNSPKENSYVFEGIVGENPVKVAYFTNKNNIYSVGLIGNCDTGGQYTPDANAVFQNILGSVKFQ